MKKIFNLISNIYFIIRKGIALPGSLVVTYKKKNGEKLFLLIKSHHSNAVTFPSGNLNLFENFIEAAQRELLEETGLKIEKEKLLLTPLTHTFTYKNFPLQIKSHQKVFLVLLSADKTDFNPLDKDIEWVQWYSLEKTLLLLSYSELKITFKKVIEYLENCDQ